MSDDAPLDFSAPPGLLNDLGRSGVGVFFWSPAVGGPDWVVRADSADLARRFDDDAAAIIHAPGAALSHWAAATRPGNHKQMTRGAAGGRTEIALRRVLRPVDGVMVVLRDHPDNGRADAPALPSDRARAYAISARLTREAALKAAHGDGGLAEIRSALTSRIRSMAPVGAYANGAALQTGEMTPDAISELVAALSDMAAEEPVDTSSGPALVEISLGVARIGDDETAGHAQCRADDAAALALEAGKPICWADPPLAGGMETDGQDLELARDGRLAARALRDDKICIAYQPVVRAETPELVGYYECLVRILDDMGEPTPAARFVPAADRLGLTRLIDRRVLELALRTLADAPYARLAVNVSAATVRDRAWRDMLREAARMRRDVGERLIIEIGEQALGGDVQALSGFVDAVRQTGAAVAIDDFGAGRMSVRQLAELRPDIVKIDGVIIQRAVSAQSTDRGGLEREGALHLIRSLVELSSRFDMMTVAEGVAQAEEIGPLYALGVDALQGEGVGAPALEPGMTVTRSGQILRA